MNKAERVFDLAFWPGQMGVLDEHETDDWR